MEKGKVGKQIHKSIEMKWNIIFYSLNLISVNRAINLLLLDILVIIFYSSSNDPTHNRVLFNVPARSGFR